MMMVLISLSRAALMHVYTYDVSVYQTVLSQHHRSASSLLTLAAMLVSLLSAHTYMHVYIYVYMSHTYM